MPMADENADHAFVFVPVEQMLGGHVLFRIGRTAIDAAEVAAVGDGDPEVGDLAAEFVSKRHDKLSDAAQDGNATLRKSQPPTR